MLREKISVHEGALFAKADEMAMSYRSISGDAKAGAGEGTSVQCRRPRFELWGIALGAVAAFLPAYTYRLRTALPDGRRIPCSSPSSDRRLMLDYIIR
jgi:hypothetical protein